MNIFNRLFNTCKNLAPVTKEREKANKHLQGKFFCLYKLKKTGNYIEENYKSVLCEYYSSRMRDCPDFEK